ncbi:alpha/beta fold hydrolase [Sphingomonas baiyangensis]|uniref:Alpha/beta hydrolase n=1 Tax=Sphingomonas baiyangensis TaxID=2572576 RepID=A0A4U1L5I1_9SPHN|nr:alpha/beta hydrolase [Sphingomonas baiyangensis]TKD51553.1 alpha/beta hydrolase [Sphingomonas baiyangensis]
MANVRKPIARSAPATWFGAGLATLAGAAIFNRWSAARAERDHPPIGAFVEVDGMPVHYYQRGAGPAIVLIHGSASLVEDFVVSGLVDLLSHNHRVIAFDRPGYGYTRRPRDIDWTPERQASLLVAACAQLGIDRPLVVGHSWGTLPALAWALNNPEAISGLALLSGYYFPTGRPDAAIAAIAGAPGIGDVFANTVAPLQTRITGPLGNKIIFSPADPTDAFLTNTPFALMLRPSQLRATAIDSGQMPASAARLALRYDELDLPIAIVWGDGDKLVEQEDQSPVLAKQLPKAVETRIEGVGHMIHHTSPSRVAAAILAVGHCP